MSDDISIPSPTYRVPRHSGGMDPATRKLALIAAAIGGTMVVVVGGWTMLNHRSSQGVPVVQADSSPLRVKPVNPGGLQVAGAGNDIFSGGSDTDVGKLAPPPETPDPQGLLVAPPPRPAPGPLNPSIAAVQPLPEPAPALATRTPAPAAEPAAAAPKPVVASAATPPARAAEKPSAAAAAQHSAGSKGALVQLAALSSEEAARAEWERLVKRWPDLFGGHQPAFSKIDHGGQTFWRVRTGGFDGVSQATTFCERLRAKGGGCSVADF